MKNNLIGILIGAVVGIILIGSLLAPVIQDFEKDNTYTYTNGTENNVLRATYVEVDPAKTYTILYNDTIKISVDGTVYDATGHAYDIVFASDVLNLRPVTQSTTTLTSIDGSRNIIPTSDENPLSMSMTIVDGVASITAKVSNNTTYTLEAPITWFAYYNPDGDSVIGQATSGSTVYYYKDINSVKGANWISTTSEWYSFTGTDVLVDGEATTADLVNVQDLPGEAHSFKFTNSSATSDYTFVVDNSGEDYTVAPYVYVTDYSFTTISEQDSTIATLFAPLIILSIVGILMFVVRGVLGRND